MGADTSWMDAANPDARPSPATAGGRSRRPIGEIFVELGFVTRAQLDAALAVQQQTGGRIGEILVEQGSLTRLDLASALAEHWEPHPYPDRGPAEPSQAETERDTGDPSAQPEIEPGVPPKPRRRLRRRQPPPDGEPEPVDALAARLAVLDEIVAAIADLSRSLESLDAVRAAEALATGARLAGVEAAVAGLEERVAGLDRVESASAPEVERGPVAEPPAPVAAEGCLAFAPTASGYRLVELPDTPELGAILELDGVDGPLVVTRLAGSPLPFDDRPCAFLDRVRRDSPRT